MTDTYYPDASTRPDPAVLVVAGAEGELHQIGARAAAGAPGWYQRVGQIVVVSEDERGRPTIAPLPYARFHTRLCELVRWRKLVKHEGDWEEVDTGAPKPISESVFAGPDRGTMPALIGVRDTPILRPDGTLWQKPGYDAASKCIFAPSMSFPQVPTIPTQEQAADALWRLQDLFCDFVYERPSQVSVPISAMLALIGRDAIAGAVPAHLFTAPQPGTGKGLQLEVISQACLGHRMIPFHLPMPSIDDRNESERHEEQEKRLAGEALEGTRALFIDNVKNGSTFGGHVLDRFITAPLEVKLRLLGKNKNPMAPWLTLILVSGNHVHVHNDSRRRCLEAKLVPTCAKPHLRDQSKFKHPLAHGFALSHRGEIVRDLLTILVGHACAKRPRAEGRLDVANFEAWQSVVCDAIVWAGGHDPTESFLTDDDGLSGEDALVSALMRVLSHLGAYAGGTLEKGATATDVITTLWSSEWQEAIKENRPTIGEHQLVVDARELFTSAWKLPNAKRPSAKSLGGHLGDLCGRVLSGGDVWPADDASGFQRSEWRISSAEDRHTKSPRYTLVPPRGT